jgi:competence protein ComEC
MRLILLTAAWLGGIFLGHWLWTYAVIGCDTPLWPAGLLSGLLILACVVLGLRRHFRVAGYLMIGLFCLLGAWRYQFHPFALCASPGDLAYYHRQAGASIWATVEGTVAGYPDVRDTQTLYTVQVDHLTIDSRTRPVHGLLLAQAPRTAPWSYGDRLRLSGLLEAPPTFADFDYRAYLARQDIYSILRRANGGLLAHDRGSPAWAALYALRRSSSGVINRSLPEPAAALANGMLLGIESGIRPELSQAFKDTGTSHVIVISGSNIALLAGLLLAAFGRILGRRRAAWLVIPALGLYVLLVGAGSAAVRAGIMGTLAVGALVFGRQSTPLVFLAASALFMTVVNPLTLWDIGFQLSLLATLGLILFNAPLQAQVERWLTATFPLTHAQRVAAILGDVLVVTVAAQITTLPLMLYYFGRVSLISLLANFMILPAQPLILVWGLLMLAGGLLWLPLGQVLASLPWLFLVYTTQVVTGLSRVPLAAIDTGPWGRILAILCYALLMGALGWRWLSRRGWPARLAASSTIRQRQTAAWATCLGLPLLIAITIISGRPDGKLHIYFAAIPNDPEAALLALPGGRTVYLQGTFGAVELATAASSPASTRIDAAPVASGMLPAGVRTPDVVIGQAMPAAWGALPLIDPARLAPGQVLQLDRDVQLRRLATTAEPACLLSYGGFTLLWPPALAQDTQAALAAAPPVSRLTLVKLPGPGTGTWPVPGLIDVLAPQVTLWPEDTTYPPEVVAHLAGRPVVSLPAGSTGEVITDGQSFWLRQWSGLAAR